MKKRAQKTPIKLLTLIAGAKQCSLLASGEGLKYLVTNLNCLITVGLATFTLPRVDEIWY